MDALDTDTLLWSKQEVARQLGISVRSVDELRQNGEITAVQIPGMSSKLIRFRSSDIRALVATASENHNL